MSYYVDNTGKAKKVLTICSGVFPSGKKEITDTTEVNVRNYETAQVVDSNLIAENIKKDISILGVVGTFEEPIYEGSYEITENGTLATSGKKLTQDLVVNVSSGGGDTNFKDLVEGTITSVDDSTITKVGDYAFDYNTKLTSVNLPNAKTIGIQSFAYCMFLTSVNLPLATRTMDYSFNYCNRLTSIDLPQLTSVGAYSFISCSSLTSVNLPLATSTGSQAFSNCSSLTNIYLPQLATMGSQTFSGCSSLARVDLPLATSIDGYSFASCGLLKTLIIRTNQVCTLKNASAFNNTPIKTSTTEGFIYVPDDLVESYKTATNWSTYASKIKGLSELGE